MRRTATAAGSVDVSSSASSLLHRSAAEQIRDAVADRAALRRRTQLKRGQYDIVGQQRQQHNTRHRSTASTTRRGEAQTETKSGTDEDGADDGDGKETGARSGRAEDGTGSVSHHSELFDDLDFYQRLLHDAISAQQQQQQQQQSLELPTSSLSSAAALRRSLKGSVDRRASKGRKLQYTPIAKLSNFMAPVPSAYQQHSRDERAVDQIVANLFGVAATAKQLLPIALRTSKDDT